MAEKEEYNILSLIGLVLYIILAVTISAILFMVMNAGVSLLIEHLTLPSEVFKVFGFAPEAGIGHWSILVCDHIIRILLMSISFSFILSVGLNALNQIPNVRCYFICYIAYTIAMLCGVGTLCLNSEIFPTEMMPRFDIVISLFLIGVFSFFFFMRQGSPTIKENLKSVWGIGVASIICLVILYVTLLVTVYIHMLSQFLDIWNYVDMFFGSDCKWLHIVLQISSHIHNFLFLGLSLGFGIYLCCVVIDKFVPSEVTARFYQSSVILWSMEFLLFAITDGKSMSYALMDKYDFGAVILVFALVSVLALFGFIRELYND